MTTSATVTPWYDCNVAQTKKIAISLDDELATEVHDAARSETNGNVSAWLANAARRELRRKALREAVAGFEKAHGAIGEAAMAEARRKWAGK